jgi:hypothetical protein
MSAKTPRLPDRSAPARKSQGALAGQGRLFPESERPEEGPIGYTTRLLVATTLPHSRSEDNEFTRSSGLTISAC